MIRAVPLRNVHAPDAGAISGLAQSARARRDDGKNAWGRDPIGETVER